MFEELRRLIVCSTAASITAVFTLSNVEGASAVNLFSVDVNSDSLVKIDSETGLISAVGTLEFDAIHTDLASFNNRLFILNQIVRNRVDIYEVNPFTAETISSSQVFFGENAVIVADSLANVGTQLKIGFSASSVFDPWSESLGDLSLTGEITNVISTTGTFDDFDGLGGDGISQLFSVDVIGDGFGPSPIFAVNPNTGSLNNLTIAPGTANDLVVSEENLFLIDNGFVLTEAFLFIISTSNGAITSTVPLGNGNYLGLAVAPEAEAVPESRTILGTGLALGLGALFLKRKQKKCRQ